MPAKLTKYSNDLNKAQVTATVVQTIQTNDIQLTFIIPVADLIAVSPTWGKSTVASVCSDIGGFQVDLAAPVVVP